MIKTTISLRQYFTLGGTLEKIPSMLKLKFTYTGDSNRGIPIVDIKLLSEKDSHGGDMFMVSFTNGKVKKYNVMWIDIEVDMVLHEKYLK